MCTLVSALKAQFSGIVISRSCWEVFVQKDVKHDSELLFSLSQCKKNNFQLERERRVLSMTHFSTNPV